MKTRIANVIIMLHLMVVVIVPATLFAEEDKPTTSADMAVLSRYLARF